MIQLRTRGKIRDFELAIVCSKLKLTLNASTCHKMMPPRSTLNASRLVRRVFAATSELPALSTLQIYQTALAKFPNEYDPGAPQPVVPRPPRRLRDTYEFKKQQKQQKKLKAEPVETSPVHVLQSIRQIYFLFSNHPHPFPPTHIICVHHRLKRHFLFFLPFFPAYNSVFTDFSRNTFSKTWQTVMKLKKSSSGANLVQIPLRGP